MIFNYFFKNSSIILIFILTAHFHFNNLVECNIFTDFACNFYECCNKPYLLHDIDKLEVEFDKYIFGQPLVKQTVIKAIKGHLLIPNPPKPLVLSFQGLTGTGKNYVTKLIADSLYLRGRDSRFYNFFSSQYDFPHVSKIEEYKETIMKTIEEKVSTCEYSLFVFDEMDKIPIGLIDVIKPYIDTNGKIKGVDFTKAIFVFLSNSATQEINTKTFDLEQKSINRDKFELKMFQKIIHEHNFNHKSDDGKGLWHSVLITNHLIDHYIPFLPLRREHVRLCIINEFEKYNINPSNTKTFEDDVDLIANELDYEPTGYNFYSSSGCKRIPTEVRKFNAKMRFEL